jgi:proteasome accessory factor C
MEGRLGQRMRRILLMLPYAINNPGIGVEELASRFEVSKRKVIDDLNLVFLCGLPGYGPGDLIDVAIDEDRVYVGTADYFSAPLRLTPAEALALYAGAQALVSLPDMQGADALKRALVKLGRALGIEDDGGRGAIRLELLPGPAGHLARLRRSLEERKRVRIEYMSAASGALTERVVEPWGLIVAWGRSYLVGWDRRSDDERMFRIDRVKSVEVLDAAASIPADFDPERYSRAFVDRGEGPVVSFEVSPEVARWFADYYPVRSMRRLADGWHGVRLAAASDHWAATVVLRLGAAVRAVEPQTVATRASELARAIVRKTRQASV